MNTIDPVHFLLVDDLEENLLALEALLRREDLVLLKARSSMEGLELLLKHDIALALIDIQMPEMDGFEMAELMRGNEQTKTVPIIFLTAGHSDQQRRFRGYEAGAVDFLQKPIETDVLKSKADVFFQLYRQRQHISHLLKETQQYANELKEADRRKDEFLATLSHELRNPLAPIRNGLQILRLDPQGERAESVRDMMERQLTHMVRMVDDLLDMARVSKGKIELRKCPITLQSAVESAIESSRPQIEKSYHQLHTDIPQDPIWIDADLTRLAQAVSNLLNNAAKYTPDGGNITLAIRNTPEFAIIQVSDTGVGIPADMLKAIFDLFTQVDTTLEHSQGGLGIGLALVKKLITMHGATITAQSAGTNKGSVFTIQIPTIAGPISHESEKKNQSEKSASPLEILVVDDNVESAKTTGWMLDIIGHHVEIAHSGPQALDAARNLNPHVILLDIGLPGMNGYEVCREIRKDPRFKNTVMIAQTGWGQKRDREMAQEAGFDHHLTKPLSLEQLEKLLADVRKKHGIAA